VDEGGLIVYGPRKPKLKVFFEYLSLATVFLITFVTVYGFTNTRASEFARDELLVLYHPLELEIPFLPGWFLVYMSIGFMLWTPLFFCPTWRWRRFFVTQMLTIFGAGFFFYFFPFDCGFIRTIPVDGSWSSFLEGFYGYDHPHNLVPSLHIGFCTGVLLWVRGELEGRWYYFFHIWALAIYASVLFTHQHHVIDIVTGIILSVSMYQLANIICDRMGTYFAMSEGE
jgi:hypothetical protein